MMRRFSILFLLAATVGSTAVAQAPVKDGDHIAIIGNTFADQLRIHGYLETRLRQHLPDIALRNLGWGGDTLSIRARPTNFPDEKTTLTEHETDVVIACFGLGESFDGLERLDEFKKDLRELIATHTKQNYNGKSPARLVLVSPIAQEDHGTRTPNLVKRNRELAAYAAAMKEVAAAAKLPFVDLYTPSLELMQSTDSVKLTTNGITLNALGYWAISHTFCEQLIGRDLAPTRIDLGPRSIGADHKGVNRLRAAQNRITFFTPGSQLASPPPPNRNAELPAPLQALRDSLRFRDLAPGTHQLSIDGKNVTSGTKADWAAGKAIDQSPAHDAVEKLRADINEKNLQFTYGWKALNQVHIVGERRTSPSGRALPKEVEKFKELAKQQENALRERSAKETSREWKLVPIR